MKPFFATLPKHDSCFNVIINPVFIESIEPGASVFDPHDKLLAHKRELLNGSCRIKMQSGAYFWIGIPVEEVMKRITPPLGEDFKLHSLIPPPSLTSRVRLFIRTHSSEILNARQIAVALGEPDKTDTIRVILSRIEHDEKEIERIEPGQYRYKS